MADFTNPSGCPKIGISVECHNLQKKDTMSNSDPFVVLFIKEGNSAPWVSFGKTETVQDQHNPQFSNAFKLDYRFEQQLFLKFEVYDEDAPITDLERDLQNQDFLGRAETDLAILVHNDGQKMTVALRDDKNQKIKSGTRLSMISFHIEEVNEACAHLVHLQLAADKLPKMDFWGKGDPYFEIHRSTEGGSWVKCHTSEVIKNTKSPRWKRFKIPMQIINNGDQARPIKIKLFDWNKDSEPDFIGETQTSLFDMLKGQQQFTLKNPNLKKKKKADNRGQLLVQRCKVEKRSSFMEFLQGGMDMQLLVAIDFTGSNGHPRDSGTLHHRGHDGLSPYSRALLSVGRVLAPYDSDGMIPAWGFGAVYQQKVSHCFPLNGNQGNPEVRGVQGLMEAYNRLLDEERVNFSGPTLFEYILRNAMYIAQQPGDPKRISYYILLILTDGVITDQQKTIDALVKASKLPLSVIIVGIGNADFTKMDELDGDDGILHDQSGQPAEADIVQFVPFNKFKTPDALAAETLKEVPQQFLGYMARNKIGPKPRTQAETFQHAEEALMRSSTGFQPSPQEESGAGTLPPGWEMAYDGGGNPVMEKSTTKKEGLIM